MAEQQISDKQFATTLARGLDLLRCFSPQRPALSNGELSALTGLSRPTVSRFTYTLTKLGYLKQERRSGNYELGTAVVALGYPFHPPGKPENLRTAHLLTLRTPMLVCQGERDPFGTAAEVPGYDLPDSVTLHWAPDGDHSLKPRKASGRTERQNLTETADAIAAFLASSLH